MNPRNAFATRTVWKLYRDLAVKTSWAQQGWIEHVWTVGRREDNDFVMLVPPVHLREQLIECLFSFVVNGS